MNVHVPDQSLWETETRAVVVNANLWAALIRYAIAERINLETAVNQFIRDGLESA
jgi:hypothetical protein